MDSDTPVAPAGYLLHAAFFLIVGSSAIRMAYIGGPLCPYLIALNLLLAATYAAGLTFWGRLHRGRAVWLGTLLLLWLTQMTVAPAAIRPAFAWCALPLACLAVRALVPPAYFAVIAGITAVLAATAAQPGGFEPDSVIAPIAGVWAAAALYRGQVRDTEIRQHLIDQLRSTRSELARQQRTAGALAERNRLAREIHDTLAQELGASRTLLQAAERDWPTNPDRARTRVRTVTEALGDNLVEVRRMIADLSPPELDDHDLPAALGALCVREQRCGTAGEVRFRSLGEPRPLPDELTATLLRVAQGALANIRDHAHACQVTVTLCQNDDEVTLQVRDDGVGFTPGRTATAPMRGFGLPGMRQRLQVYGGALSVASTPGGGTLVTGRLPLHPAEATQLVVAG
jgi:signal transduction histidine kinase